MKPYVFFPKDYYHYSGGVRALHYLCHWLNFIGSEAYIGTINGKYPKTCKRLNTPIMDTDDYSDCIAIYPERVEGNPLGCETTVRYLLHKKGYFNGPEKFDDNFIFAYSPLINEGHDILWTPCIELDLFNPYTENIRDGGCYFVGKGDVSTEHLIEDADELSLANYPTRKSVAEKLKSSEYLVTFDDYTLLVFEALMCDTKVIVVDSNYSEKQLENYYHFDTNGVDFYVESLGLFLSKYLPDFVERTQNETT